MARGDFSSPVFWGRRRLRSRLHSRPLFRSDGPQHLAYTNAYLRTSTQAQLQIDQQLVSLWSAIQAQQTVYLASNGDHFQGAQTTASIPADGVPLPVDPTTQLPEATHSYLTAGFVLPSVATYSSQLHVYDGPQGKGHTLIVTATFGNQRWRKVRHSGSEVYREQDWTPAPPSSGGPS